MINKEIIRRTPIPNAVGNPTVSSIRSPVSIRKPDLMTAMILTYNRPHLLKVSVGALLRQTYDNLEIIVINNGGTGETVEYLNEVAAFDERVKLISFKENQGSLKDTMRHIRVCLNTGLQEATGDYISYYADDDFIADDYLEKMVSLFKGDPECTTAMGIPVTVDIDGNVTDPGPRDTNIRPRYMPGHEMILRSLRGEKKIFGSPGPIFTFKREALIQAGGYYPALEKGERFGIVPFGVTGFDETAVLYFRYHAGQRDRLLSSRGSVGIEETFALIADWKLEERWKVFGDDIAREVVTTIEKNTCVGAAAWFVRLVYSWRYPAAFKILRKMWKFRQFWAQMPKSAIEPMWIKQLGQVPIRGFLKLNIRLVFRLAPRIATISPRMVRLNQRVNRKRADR